MTNHIAETEFQTYQFAREQLQKELIHWREKLWKIFSWAATILVAITGGAVALKTDPVYTSDISRWLWVLVIISVVFLTVYASLWIKQNLAIVRKLQMKLGFYDHKLGIKSLNYARPKFGYNQALILLAASAILASILKM